MFIVKDDASKPARRGQRSGARAFADFFDDAPVAIHCAGPDGVILRANQAELALLGYSRDEYVGHHVAEFHADRDVADDFLRRMHAGHDVRDFEARLRCKDGNIKHVCLSASVLWENGELVQTRCYTRDITDRKRAEQKQRDSEERYLQLLGLMPAAVYTCEAPSGVITFYNAHAAALWGRAPTLGHTDERFCGSFRLWRTDGTLLPHAETPMALALREGRSFRNEEVVIERPDGTRIAVLVNIDPVLDQHGNLAAAVNVFHDVTALKQAQAALRESEHRLRTILDTLPAAIYTTDASGRLTHFNPAAVEFSGRVPTLGTDEWCVTWKLYHPDGTPMPHAECPMAVALKEGRPVRGARAIAERPDGTRIWFEPYPTPLKDHDGRIVGGINMLVDVTERTQAEEARARLAAIVDSSADAVISEDLEGTITSWNRAAERLYGYSASETVGQPIAMLMPPDRLREEIDILEQIRGGRRIEHYETVRRRKDGNLVDVSLSVSAVVDGQGKVVGASKIARDITERRKADEALREADRRKNEFLAILAHELRNPLAPIRYATSIAAHPGSTESQRRHATRIIERQTEHMARLLDDLLDVSRITRGAMELRKSRIELTSVVASAIEAARPLIDAKQHALTVDLPKVPLQLTADPVRVSQIVSNLLTNAAKYTDAGGHIELRAALQGDEVVISVRDDGIGIGPEMMPRLFTLFSQDATALERSEGGLGVGLALVHGLAALHGGSVQVHSEGRNRGSEFVVRLPRGASESGDVPEVPSPAKAKPASRLKVVVADDNRDNADACATLLELFGHEVRVAHSGRQLLEIAEQFRPRAVLLDIGMPELNGYEIAERIRSAPWGESLTLVAVTGWGQEEDRRRAFAAGFDHHLTKPVDPERLRPLLQRLSP